ncbi:MAG: tetratricopeptide repeat protein [Chitinivibrionales bacterium]|nr:tetratricopeptide repeat protein [Chitinivibrionales bacterium]
MQMYTGRKRSYWARGVVAALVFGLLSQCAFLNTFYNARRAFGIARRMHRKQHREYPDSLIEPTGEALSNYDRAIAKSQKVLDVYHRRERWHDDAIYYAGLSYYYKMEMNAAIRQFRRLQEEFPGSEYVPQSCLYLARAYLYDERYQKAEEMLALIVEKYPELDRNEEVSLLRAKLALRREGKMQAIELLEKVRGSVTSVERRIELSLRMAALYMELKRYGKALDVLLETPRKRREYALMYRIDHAMLTCYLRLDSLDAGLRLANRMLATKGYQAQEAEVLLSKGDILLARGDTEGAIEIYEKITDRHEKTPQAGMAWYKLGEIYHLSKGDEEKAKECYEKAASTATDSTVIEVASRRAKALGEVDTLRAQFEARPDSADSVHSDAFYHVAIGELFWLELNQPDSAYGRYQAILADTTASEEMVAKALFASGYIALHGRADTAAADSFFAELEQRYPASEYSKRAQVEQNERVTVQTRADSALAAFHRAERLFFEQDNAVDAVESYLKVYNEYKDLDIAPKSLYAAAWLCDNVTYNKEAAQFLYKKLCDKYPESSACSEAAKPRLRIAMDSTESISKRRSQKAR